MSELSNSPSHVVDAPEKTFRGLRRFNAVMGLLHLVQGILMIVLSNDKTYPSTPTICASISTPFR